MAQASTITINDRETTPVAHVFMPDEKLVEGFYFKEKSTIPMADKVLSIRGRKSAGRVHRRLMLTVPILVNETVNGVSVPTVPRTTLIDCNFRFDETGTEQERANAVGMFFNALAAAQGVINASIVKLEGTW